MAIYKNVASQKLAVYAYTATTGASKTGDAAQITAYLSKDWASAAAITDTNPTELDATNMKGWYIFDLTQAETNAEVLIAAPVSSTSGVVLDQVQVFTQDAAISSRASQSSVDDIPTNSEFSTALASADDAVLAAIADVPTVAEFEARTLLAADYTIVSDLPSVPSAASVADAVWDEALAGHAGAGSAGLALSTASSGGVDPSVLADAIWDEALSGHSTAGTTGKKLTDLANADLSGVALETTAQSILTDTGTTLDALIKDVPTNAELATALAAADDAVLAAIAALNNLSSAQAQSAAAAALNAYDPPTKAEMDARTLLAADYTIVSDLPSVPTAASVADAVWDEALAGHAGAGSAGLALATASSGGVDPSVLADAIWDEALAGHATAGTAGKKLTDLANADLSGVATAAALATVDGVVDAILVDTGTTIPALIDNMPTSAELTSALAAADDATLAAIAALNNLSSAQAQSAAAAALTAYDPPTKAELDSAVSPLATAAALDTVDNLLDTEVAAIKTVTDQLATTLELDGAVYRYTANALELSPTGGSAPTAAAIADAVWDEAIAGHAVAGSTGQSLASAGGAADPLLNPVPGDYASGTAGAALGSLAGASVSIVSPVASDGTAINLVYGDDYAAADNRALVFSALSGPALTGGAVALCVQGRSGAVNVAGVVTGAHACYVELTDTQVASIGIGVWRYDLEATLVTSANVVTLVQGYMTVAADVR